MNHAQMQNNSCGPNNRPNARIIREIRRSRNHKLACLPHMVDYIARISFVVINEVDCMRRSILRVVLLVACCGRSSTYLLVSIQATFFGYRHDLHGAEERMRVKVAEVEDFYKHMSPRLFPLDLNFSSIFHM